MTWKPRYWLLVMAGLFIAGFIANVVSGDIGAANTILQWAIAAVCIAAFMFITREERERAALLRFLQAERDAIRAGTAQWRGHTLTYATRLRTSEVVLSFLVASVRLPSRYVIAEGTNGRGIALGCSLVAFVFGWWGLPWGPLWTIRAIANNLRGKPDVSIGELLEVPSAVTALPAASARR